MAYQNTITLSGKALDNSERKGAGPYRFCIVQGGGKKKDSDERWPKQFFNCMAWPNNLPDVEKIRKDEFVTITGRLVQREYQDKDNLKRRIYEIQVQTMDISDSRKADAPKPLTPELNYHGIAITDDDIF